MGLVYNVTKGRTEYLIGLDEGGAGGGGISNKKIIIKSNTIPEASEKTFKLIYIYAGENNGTYHHGYIYECIADVEYSLKYTPDPDDHANERDIAFNFVSPYTSDSQAMQAWLKNVIQLDKQGISFTQVASGSIIRKTFDDDRADSMWNVILKDKQGNILYQSERGIYTSDLESFGFTFVWPNNHYLVDVPSSFTMEWTISSASNYRWQQLDVQPSSGGGDMSIYQLKANISQDPTSTSQGTYPSSKALSDGLKSVKPNLYDIKLLSQAIANKGWACLSHISRKNIAKADIPTMYADILNKYNNADKGLQTYIATPSTINGVWYDGTTKKYYYAKNDNDEYKVYVSDNADLSSPSEVNIGEYNAYRGIIIGKNINVVLGGTYNTYYIYVFDKSWNYINTYEYTNFPNITAYRVIDDRIVICFGIVNTYCRLLTITDDNSATITVTDDLTDLYVKFINISDIYDGYFYLTAESDGGWCFFIRVSTTDLSMTKTSNPATDLGRPYNGSSRYTISNIVKIGDYFYIANGNKTYKSQTMEQNSWTEIETISPDACYRIVKFGNDYYIAGNGYIVKTTDFTTYQNVATFTADTYGFNKFYNFDVNTDCIIFSADEGTMYMYAVLAPVTYTDTYVINGNSVVINYVMKDGFKICLADGTNDTNLATVYSYMGYYNYYRLDTTGETISLPRNSNLYSMMYVGDNYQDTLDGISGNATRLLPQAENINITGATPTITISANKTYSFDTAITSLTISDVEVSALESVLYFRTGAGTISLSAPNTLRWGGGNEQPQLEPNTVYCIAIRNGLAEIDNFGSAS